MSITVNVIGQTNIVTSITNSDTVAVGVGTFVAQAVTGLLVAAGANMTVTTTNGVFTIIGRTPPVLSVNGKTGAVALTHLDVLAAPQNHTHTASQITDFATEAAKHGPVSSVAGKTGTVTLTAAELGAASASHTHVAANITDFATAAALVGPVSSVNGRTGTITLVATDVSAASATHAHSYVQSLNGITGTPSIFAGANITITTSTSGITIAGPTAVGGVGNVTSVNGQTGTVVLTSASVSAASAVHTHVAANITDFAAEAAKYGPVSSINGQTGTVTISTGSTALSVAARTVTTTVNNYDAGTTDIVRIEATTNLTVTGLAGGAGGVVRLLVNPGPAELSFDHESTNSSATNRFVIVGSGSHVLRPNESVTSFYDSISGRNRLLVNEPAAPGYLWATITPTAALHNHPPGTATVLRVDPTTPNCQITGFSGGRSNTRLVVINVSTNTVTLVSASTFSDAHNRLIGSRTMNQDDRAMLLYDPVSLRHRVGT